MWLSQQMLMRHLTKIHHLFMKKTLQMNLEQRKLFQPDEGHQRTDSAYTSNGKRPNVRKRRKSLFSPFLFHIIVEVLIIT